MEYFICPCPGKGKVLLNGKDMGPNKDAAGNLLTKQCNEGMQTVLLVCNAGKKCQHKVLVEIKDTDPICPMEVPFKCE